MQKIAASSAPSVAAANDVFLGTRSGIFRPEHVRSRDGEECGELPVMALYVADARYVAKTCQADERRKTRSARNYRLDIGSESRCTHKRHIFAEPTNDDERVVTEALSTNE